MRGASLGRMGNKVAVSGLFGRAFGDAGLFRRGIVLATVSSAWLWLAGAVATFAIGVFMARQLGPAGYGVYGTTLAIVALLGVPAQIGLPLLATRDVAAAGARGDLPLLLGLLRWFTLTVLVMSVVVALLLAAVAVVGKAWFLPDLRSALMLGALLVPGFALCALFAGIIRGQGRVVAGQALDVVLRPALFCLGLAALFVAGRRLSVDTAIVLQAISALAAAAVGLWIIRRGVPRGAGDIRPAHHVRQWLSAALPMTLTEGMRQIDGTYGVLLVSLLTTTADAGLYRVALSSLALISMPISLLNIVVAPYFARFFAAGDMPAVQRLAAGAAGAMTVAVGGMTLGFALFGRWALETAFGAAYLPAYLPLLILCAAQLATAISGIGITLLSMTHRERILSRLFTISVLVAIALALVFIPLFGANGAAAAMLGSAILRGVLVNREARRSIGIRPSVLSLATLWR